MILFDSITASPADKAFFVVDVQSQRTGIKLNGLIDTPLDFTDFAQIKIRVVTIMMTVKRIYAFSKIPLGKSGPFGAVDMESCVLNADIGFI